MADKDGITLTGEVDIIDPRKWNDAKIRKEFECYGVSFDPEEGDCQGCLVRDRCIRKIALKIPKILEEAGEGRDVDDGTIAERIGDCEESTVTLGRRLLGYFESKKVKDPGSARERVVYRDRWKKGTEGNPIETVLGLPPQAGPSEEDTKLLKEAGEEESDGEPEGAEVIEFPTATKVKEEEEAPKQKKKAPTKKKAPKPPPEMKEPAPEPEEAAKKKAATKKKAPAKKAAAKKTTKKAAAKKKAPAKKAPTRKAPVPKKSGKKAAKKKAPTKKVSAPKTKESPASRFERERRRSPKVAALRPGQRLKREYKGETHVVTVAKSHYTYRGEQYATLYSIVMAITGAHEYARQGGQGGTRVMSNWSVPKFFQL